MRGVIIFVITMAVLGGVRMFIKGGSIEKQLKKAETEINQSCPKMIDEFTRMDKVEVVEKNITYYYTVIGLEDADVLDARDAIMMNATKSVRANPETKKLLKKKITLNCVYKNQRGKQLISFSVKEE